MVASFTKKISTKYNQFKDRVFVTKLQNDMQKHGILGFVERNTKTDLRILHDNPQFNEVRVNLLARINDELAGPKIIHPVSIPAQHLREPHKEPHGALDTLPPELQDQVKKWHALIPDYTACQSTLGRKNLSTIQIAGVPLKKLSGEIGEKANVAFMCQQLEIAFLKKWPNANIQDIQQLVVDAVTLMAIDINPIKIRGELNAIRMGLMSDEESSTNRRMVASDKVINPDYEFTFPDSSTPTCILQVNQEFKDVEGDPGDEIKKGEFSLKSTITVTKSPANGNYIGSVAIERK